MELDLEVCRTIAIRHGLPLQFVFKEFHLMNILGRIASKFSSNNNYLVFKGGTALNKVYINKTQRFSEDLDFDLVVPDASKRLLNFSKELAKEFIDYKIEEFRKVKNTIQFYCVYETPLSGKDNIRIDIAPKTLITSKTPENKNIYSEFTHSSVSGVKTYSIEDLTARKINALSSREEGKDVFDVNAALSLCSKTVIKDALKKILKSENKDIEVSVFLNLTIENLKQINVEKLKNLTNPFIPVPYRPKNWNELKENLIMKLKELQSI